MPTRCVAAGIALALAAVIPALAHARAKTDVVFLTNGDRITGEIKHFDRGILTLGTDGIGTINIEWDDVDSVSSVYQFRVEDHAGTKYFGSLLLARNGVLQIAHQGRTDEILQAGVVAMTPLEASFWEQLDGSLSFGLSYTKANRLGQLTLDAAVRRVTRYRWTEFEISSLSTSQEDRETQTRDEVTLTHRRLFGGKLFGTGGVAFQHNDELGLDLRSSVSLGAGANLIRTNHNDLIVTAGLSGNQEQSAGVAADVYNLEAFFSLGFEMFRYDSPKTDIKSEMTAYPNLTTWGRVRSELDLSARREIAKDFFLSLSLYDSYDSEPADAAAQKNDYGLVTSIGWSF